MLPPDVPTRARSFGTISGMGGVGAAAGPLLGGLITTAISWRAAFGFQALIIVVIIALSRGLDDPVAPDPQRPFDTVGAALSAVGLTLLVMGIVSASTSALLMVALVGLSVVVLAVFVRHVRAKERAGEEPLLSTALFRNRTSNLGLVTQNIQWLMLMGVSFVVSAYLQVVRGSDAVETGLIFTAATVGILGASLAAEPLAKKHAQRSLVIAGFTMTILGILALLAMVAGSPGVFAFTPGLLLIGVGVGTMLTPSVNIVQSSFPEEDQGEISGLSRSVSNLGSSLGTAVAGTILVAGLGAAGRSYGIAMASLAVAGVIGLAAAWKLPATTASPAVPPVGSVPTAAAAAPTSEEWGPVGDRGGRTRPS